MCKNVPIVKSIPYGHQWIDDDDIRAVIDVLKSDYITTGPKIPEFEAALSDYTGAGYVTAVSSGTAALHAACFAAGIKPGDEVITSPLTFAATSNAILYCGGKPVFADVDEETYNIRPENIKKLINRNTRAIIPVHYAGQPCDMDIIMSIANSSELIVIEDSSHALGAEYKGKKIGTIGQMSTFSFHPVKHITTGEGGAVATSDNELHEKLNMFRTHGITRSPDKLSVNEGSWFYEQQFLGYNYRITDMQAALGISQLRKQDKNLIFRKKYAKIYDECFYNIEEISIPRYPSYANPSWHLYVIKLELSRLKAGRAAIFEELKNMGIGVNVHYIPVYMHPYYKSIGYEKGLCPAAERLYESFITIPLYPSMQESDVLFVADAVKQVIEKYKV